MEDVRSVHGPVKRARKFPSQIRIKATLLGEDVDFSHLSCIVHVIFNGDGRGVVTNWTEFSRDSFI